VGTQEQTPEVKTQVLEKGESYSGLLSVLNTPYLVSYMAVKDMDGAVVGMLFVGRPQATVLAVAAKSIEVTFITTAILMMLAILPAYKISKFIAEQLS
jgi:methyl-accepting chemotaxis protein